MPPIRCSATVDPRSAPARWPMRWPSATARSAPPSTRRCWRGSTSSPASGSPSATPRSPFAPRSANEPDKLAGGIGFGPRLLVSEAALRATGLVQPGSLVHWHYRLRLPANAADNAALQAVQDEARAQLPQAGWDVRTRSKVSPRLEQQCRTLQPVPHPGRPDRAAGRRRRRRQCGEEPPRPAARHHRHHESAGRERPPRLHDLSHASRGDGADRRRSRARCSAPRCPSPYRGRWARSFRTRSCRRCTSANCCSRSCTAC